MKHQSNLFRLPASVWRSGFFAALVLLITATAATQETGSRKFAVKPLPLPGANGLVMLDYFQYDNATRRLWVPAANTGSVDVIDTTTDQIKSVEGFSSRRSNSGASFGPWAHRPSPSGMGWSSSAVEPIRGSA